MPFTSWYRLRCSLPWMQGPTRDSERDCWEALFSLVGKLGGASCGLRVLGEGKWPWQ